MSDHSINPDLTLRSHACHYETDIPKTDAPDYTNCSGARADLGEDE